MLISEKSKKIKKEKQDLEFSEQKKKVIIYDERDSWINIKGKRKEK